MADAYKFRDPDLSEWTDDSLVSEPSGTNVTSSYDGTVLSEGEDFTETGLFFIIQLCGLLAFVLGTMIIMR